MQYLIGYDICDSKRLQRVYKRLCQYATPLQYSLFLFDGTKSMLDECLTKILAQCDKAEDDLRVYPIEEGIKRWQLGKGTLPEGIVWLNAI